MPTPAGQGDTMGVRGRSSIYCRRIMCRRVSVYYLRLALTILFVVCGCLTINYIAFPRAEKYISSRSGLSFLATIQDLESSAPAKIVKNRTADGPGPRMKSGGDVVVGRRNVTKTLYIHSELKPILTWNELEDLVACVRVESGKLQTKPCSVQCPSGDRLKITLGTDLMEARTMDAVLFGMSPFTLRWSFQKVLAYKPPPGQLSVFYSMENALRMHKWNPRLGMLNYHIDMTYGVYSNVSIPYAQYKPFPGNVTKGESRNWMEGKTKLIAWMASNCKEVFWPRNEFIVELQRHMKVDTYGRCGNLTCLPRLSEECTKMLTKYKFYLSIENSECDDYLTEKIWASALENDVIPVVYGPTRADYEKYAPPNSFIHVSDFASIEDLAKYIKRVATDVKLYNSYFKWRELGEVHQMYPKLQVPYFCSLLPYMDGVSNTMQQVKDSGWFKSCRHKLQVRKDLNLTAIQTLEGWKPW